MAVTFSGSIDKNKIAEVKNAITAYQENVSQPVDNNKWYKGDQPTKRETLGQIYQISLNDPESGNALQKKFMGLQNDQNSMFWNPYLKPTTVELGTLSQLGYDVSNINDDWYNQTAWLDDYLVRNGSTNAPSKPTKKQANNNTNAAYARFKVAGAQGQTDKAKLEMSALQDEINFLANWKDRNYSDDEIWDYIHGDTAEFKKKYPTLSKMEDSLKPGGTILEFNEAIPYSEDWVYGQIWAARNDGGTGNMYQDMALSALGEGNVWKDNAEIASRRKNAPYTIGGTADETLMYFNVPSYNKAWLEANRPDEHDKTAVDMWNKAWDIADFTEKAKVESEDFDKLLDRKLANATDPDAFMKKVDEWLTNGYGEKKFNRLNKLDESTQKINGLVPTSEAIQFSRYDIQKKVEEACAKNGWKPDGQQTLANNGMPAPTGQDSEANKARDKKVTDAVDAYGGDMLPSEQAVFENTPSSQYGAANVGLTDIASGDPTTLVKNNEGTVTTDYANNSFSAMPGVAENNKAKNQLAAVEKEMASLAHVKEAVDALGGLSEERYANIVAMMGEGLMDDFAVDYGEYLNNPEKAKEDPYGEQELNNAYSRIYQMVHADDPMAIYNADQETIWKEGAAWWDVMQDSDDIARYGELEASKAELENIISNTQKDVDEYNRQQEQWDERIAAYEAAGLDTTGLKTARAVQEFISQFSEYEAWQWNAYGLYDAAWNSLGDNASYDSVIEMTKETTEQYMTALENMNELKAYIAENNLQIPEEYSKNIDRYINKLEWTLKDYDYFTIRGKDDFDAVAAKGEEDERAKRYFSRLTDGFTDPLYKAMTEDEKKTFYYLAETDPQSATDYYYYLTDNSYGVLHTRVMEETKAGAKAEVDSGFWGGAFANLKAIASAPFDAIASGVYLIDRAISGGEYNPDNALLGMGQYAQTVNAATMESIESESRKKYGENSFMEQVAKGAYEIGYNRGRSLANSIFFGALGKATNVSLINEFLGSVPMATSAMAMAVAEAKEKGVSDEDALALGGINFLAESLSEAITFGNIQEAINGADDVAARSVKDLLKNWLTNSGIEEMFGESITDIVENLADEKIMGVLSEHQALVDKYISELGLNPDIPSDLAKAEEYARRDEIGGVLHTALISYLSPGLDVISGSAKDLVRDFQNVRMMTRAEQQRGNSNANMANTWKQYREWKAQAIYEAENSNQQEQQTEQEQQAPAEQQAPTEQQAPVAQPAPQRKATQADLDFLSDLGKLDAVAGSDTTTQAAAIGSLFGGEVNTQSWDQAKAAATLLPNIFGSMGEALNGVKNLIIAAHSGAVDAIKVKAAVMTAALSPSSNAAAVIQSPEYQNASNVEQAGMLADTIEADHGNETVAQEAENAVRENRVAEVEAELTREGKLDMLQDMKATLDGFGKMVQDAVTYLEEKKEVFAQRAQAVQQALNELAQNPSDENRAAQKQATDAMNAAHELQRQAEDHLKSVQRQKDEAEAKYKGAKDNAIAEMRQQAEAEIAKQDQQRLEEIQRQQQELMAAQQAEEQRLAQEKAEQDARQAEEDERTGKAWEDKRDVLIEDILNTERLEGDARETRRQELSDRADKIKLGKIDMSNMVNNTEGLLAISAFGRKTGLKFELSNDMPEGTRGKYNNGVVYLNNDLIKKGKMTVGQALVEAALHEITHSMENTKNYKSYRNIVLGALYNAGGNVSAMDLYDNNSKFRAAIDQKIADYKNAVNQDLSVEDAEKEIIADFARTRLNDRDVVMRFLDAGLGGKMRNALHNINQAIRNFRLSGEEKKTAEYLRRAERSFQKALDDVAKASVHPEGEQFSVAQIAQSTGMTFDEKTQTLYDKDGNVVDGVKNKITPDMIKETPVGLLIDSGITGEQNQKAKEMMAGLMNMIARYRDSQLIWEIGATTLSSTFSALKSNSDPQYKNTVDFGTVCAKTQEIINVMSKVMLDRVKEGKSGGLDRNEIMTVYNKVHEAGLSVPCPVCYVFSRWMGVPSLLGQMSEYQHNYVALQHDNGGNVLYDKNGKPVIDKVETQKKVNKYIKEAEKFGDAKAINKQKTKILSTLVKMDNQYTDLMNKLRDPGVSAEEKADIRDNKLKDLRTEMSKQEKELGKVNAYNWITQALCKKDSKGKYVVDDKFTVTPDEILFDLNRTGEFAKDEKNWAYRNTRGAGMGKAIMPYSGETIGDILYGVKKGGRQNTISNPWLKMDPKAAARQLKSARERAVKQNLVGGQRLQSTSDFRPEWGLDYIMSFLELQAAKSKVQMYTKVAEAVDFFASVGADVNLSIMGQGTGWHAATEDELSKMSDAEKAVRVVELGGETYVMDFSNITGMEYFSNDATKKTATALKNLYNNVQMILVGMNDTHIRLAMANDNIDFIIPWHSSGNSKDVLAGLISAVGEKLDSSVDYTTTQTDMVKGTVKKYKNEKGKTVEYTVPGKQTAEEKALWDARVKLLTKGGNALTEKERSTLLANPFTRDLYKRFTQKGVDPDCYNVKLSAAQAKQIFPYEYWDTSLTKKDADKNGKRFVEYCEAMGIVPRFSQFKDDKGYWKLLIDRPMYDNNVLNDDGTVKEYGKYHAQQVIDVTNAKIGNLNEKGELENSDLPMEAQAKYAPSDPRNPNYEKYNAMEQRAFETAKAALDEQYDDGTRNIGSVFSEETDEDDDSEDGQFSAVGEMTTADMEQLMSDYQDAVERGDMEAASEDVMYYADQKGYYDIAYHGTPDFGFTEFDMEGSSDQIFVSYDDKVAQTYAYNKDMSDSVDAPIREIGKPKPDYKSMSNDELAKLYMEKRKQTTSLKFVSQGEIKKHLSDTINNVSNYFDGKTWTDSERLKTNEDVNEVISFLARNYNREIETLYNNGSSPKELADWLIDQFISSGNQEYNSALTTLGEYYDLSESELHDISNIYMWNRFANNNAYSDGMFREEYVSPYFGNITDYRDRDDVISTVSDDKRRNGVYKLYTRPGNQLVVDAQEAGWSDISWDDVLAAAGLESSPKYAYLRGSVGVTRDIAKFAKQEGFDSLRINNVFDHGPSDDPWMNGVGDIGVFFKQADVKSADTVTYDAQGNVIPLDQRFTDGNDIRYSYGGEKTMADIEQEIDQYFDDYIDSLTPEEISDLLNKELAKLGLPTESATPQQTTANTNAAPPVAELRRMYMDALERGDQAEMRDLVDKIAKKAGYTVRGTHRTNAEFTVFDKSKQTGKNGKTLGDGFYVAKGEGTEYDSDTYGKNRMLVYIKPGKVLDVQKGGLTKQQAKYVYDKYFMPFHPTGEGYDNPYTAHVLAQLQKGYKVVDYIEEAAENNNTTTDAIFKELGYNSLKDGPQYCVFDPEQIKSAEPITYENGNPIPISERFNRRNPDYRYSAGGEQTDADRDLNQTLVDSGVVSQEDIDAYNGKPQRQFGNRTAQNSGDLSDEVKAYLFNHSDYTPDSNEAQVDRAVDWVKSLATDNDADGYHAAVNAVTSDSFDYRSADGQARMLTVMSMAATRGDTETELRLADAYNKQGTDLGQQLQARKLFRLMSPIGRRTMLQQEVAKINQEYKNNGKDTEVGLSDFTLKAAEEAQTEEDFQKVQKAAYQELAEQMPANWKERIQTWRMVSMLANVRTHVRNVVGNTIFVPTVGLKNVIGAGLESYYSDHSLFGNQVGEGERSKAVRYTDDAKAFAKQDVEAMKDTLTGEAKYSPESKLQQNKKVFGQKDGILSKTVGKFVQDVADLNSRALEAEDWVFLNSHYQNALAGYMTANNLTSADMTGKTLENARAYAVLEAQKATYRDANAVSSWLNEMSRKGGVGGWLVDTVLPFKKTPANILRRGVEYSPIGLISSFVTAKKSLDLYASWEANGKKGNMPKGAKSITQVLDGIASGLTGTAISALGALGYALGFVKLGFGGDDDDELEKLRGGQEYSIELFGHSFTIDWAAPVCMPFFTGAALYQTFTEQLGDIKDADDVASAMGSFINSLSSISEPVFNLSMLDGVSSLLKSASYSNNNRVPIFELGQNIAANYAGSMVPSFFGAVARSMDTTRRQSYVESGDPLRIWKQKIEQAQNKIPFLSAYNIPYRDVWGEADVSGYGEAFMENFILPGYLNDIKEDKLLDELQRVYDQTGDSGVIPKTASKKVGTDKLNDKEYDKYVVTRGQTAKSVLNDLINRDEFQALTPTEFYDGNPEAQAQLIGDVYTYANQVARHEYDPSYKMTGWVAKGYASGDPVGAIIAQEEGKAQAEAAKVARADLATAINAEDANAIGVSVEALKRAGKNGSQIKDYLYADFRDAYKQAFIDDDEQTMNRIKYGMMYADLGDDTITESIFEKWETAAEKQMNEE